MSRIVIASSKQIEEGTGLRFKTSHDGKPVEAFAVRYQGVVRAWVNSCTHRAVELDLGKGVSSTRTASSSLCRAHGALFDPVTGACAGGVCAKSTKLTSIATKEEGGVVYAIVEGDCA